MAPNTSHRRWQAETQTHVRGREEPLKGCNACVCLYRTPYDIRQWRSRRGAAAGGGTHTLRHSRQQTRRAHGAQRGCAARKALTRQDLLVQALRTRGCTQRRARRWSLARRSPTRCWLQAVTWTQVAETCVAASGGGGLKQSEASVAAPLEVERSHVQASRCC